MNAAWMDELRRLLAAMDRNPLRFLEAMHPYRTAATLGRWQALLSAAKGVVLDRARVEAMLEHSSGTLRAKWTSAPAEVFDHIDLDLASLCPLLARHLEAEAAILRRLGGMSSGAPQVVADLGAMLVDRERWIAELSCQSATTAKV